MTWGQISHLLHKFAPDFDLELIRLYINQAYEEILVRSSLKVLEASGTITPPDVYSAGTVAVIEGSQDVTGTGTIWTSAMTGRRFRAVGRAEWYTFTYLTAITGRLDREYEGDDNSEAGYKIFQSIFVLPAEVEIVNRITSPDYPEGLDKITQAELDSRYPNRQESGVPKLWALGPYTEVEPVQPSVEIYPIRDRLATLTYHYQRSAVGFDGSNAGSSPLPAIPNAAIINKVKAIIRTDQDKPAAADRFEVRAAATIRNAELIEAVRNGPVKLLMAKRHTRHNVARGNR